MASAFTGKPCPKCGHVRAEGETAPDWQCPKCGIVYAKFGQAPPPARSPANDAGSTPDVRRAAASEPAVEASESSGLAKIAHLSSLGNVLLPPLGTIVAVALWAVKKGEDELAVDSAKEAINFQLSLFLWAIALLVLILVIPPLAFVISFLLAGLLIAAVVMPIVATIRVSDGIRYYYPYTLHIFGEGPGS
jgi:uncharacterized protein